MKKAIMRRASTRTVPALEKDCREYPTSADEYQLLEECGKGVSATVWRALCKPFNEIVAIKLLDLENVACNLDEIIREAQTMKMMNHKNILSLHCSFMHEQQLWMVEHYCEGGSVLNIMKYGFPNGLKEEVVATIIREVLKGLDYVHKNGNIHRDVKAGNILIDKDGSVKLADFGVAATIERSGSWGNKQQARNTFVGTPCWMAPEVMEQSGYNHLADIWSVGITILELAYGHAPFARYPPMKVLMMTLKGPPPQLEDSNGRHFSKPMRELVTLCLQRDAACRPTAAELLNHKFFKHAHDASYLQRQLLQDVPSLPERVRLMRAGKGATNVQEAHDNMLRSQEEYVKGVSAWNFDVQALKQQARQEEALEAVVEGSEDSAVLQRSSHAQLPTMVQLSGASVTSQSPSLYGDAPPSPSTSPTNESSSTAPPSPQQPLAAAPSLEALQVAARADAVGAAAQPLATTLPVVSLAQRRTISISSDSGVLSPPLSSPTVTDRAFDAMVAPPPAGPASSSTSPTAIPIMRAKTPKAVARAIGRFTVRDSENEPLESPPSLDFVTAQQLQQHAEMAATLPNSRTVSSEAAAMVPVLESAISGSDSLSLTSSSLLPPRTDKDRLSQKVKKNRFTVIEDTASESTAARIPKVQSQGHMIMPASSTAAAAVPLQIGLLTPKLEELLQAAQTHMHAAQAQHEGLRALHTAVNEAAKGSKEYLMQLLKKPLVPNKPTEMEEKLRSELQECKQQVKKLEAELQQLRDENAALRQRKTEPAASDNVQSIEPVMSGTTDHIIYSSCSHDAG